MSQLEFHVEEKPFGLLARLKGEIGLEQGARFDAHLQDLAHRGARLVVIDLSGVPFMSSMQIGGLVKLHRSLAGAGGVLRIAALHPLVQSAFQVAQLHRLFEIYPTAGEAMLKPVQTS